jgi:hypothetical protein
LIFAPFSVVPNDVERFPGLQFCNEYTVPKDQLEHYKDVTAQDIVCSQTRSGLELREEDVAVHTTRIDLTCGKEDPVSSSVHFFKDFESTEKFKIKKASISLLLPDTFEDRIVRVYSKKPELVEAISEAFEEFQRKQYGFATQVHGTPESKRRRK